MNNLAETSKVDCKPFLRWAGGKNWLVKKIQPFLPSRRIHAYHELFLGGGSIYFYTQHDKSYLSDTNFELIETYEAVKSNVHLVINELKTYKNTEDFYYQLRGANLDTKYKRAARFIYLNQTSFNGIYRVNLKGVYNVPYGFRTKNFLEEDNLKRVAKVLEGTILSCGDFESQLKNISENDLVFIDPPYTVSHNNNGFVKYNKKLFSLDDQYRLSRFVDSVKELGAHYILTNAAHDRIREIFEKDDYVHELSRASLIGGSKAKRGKITEFLFTNIQK